MSARKFGLAALIGMSLFAASAARAENPLEIAMAAPERSDLARCLKIPGSDSVEIVAACSVALDNGLDGADKARALARRGNAQDALGDGAKAKADLKQAVTEYTKLIETSTPEMPLVYARGVVYHVLGDGDRAIADYNEVARKLPDNPMVFLNRGIALARYKGDYSLALLDFDRVLEIKPEDPKVMYRAAIERAAALAVTQYASR